MSKLIVLLSGMTTEGNRLAECCEIYIAGKKNANSINQLSSTWMK